MFGIVVTDLRRRAKYCDFGALKDSLISEQIVVGTNDPKLRKRLLHKTDLTPKKAIKLCTFMEQSQEQSRIFNPQTAQASSIDSVKKTEAHQEARKSNSNDFQRILKYKFYGSSHDTGNCLAYGATWNKYNGRNHCARCCFRPKTNDTLNLKLYHRASRSQCLFIIIIIIIIIIEWFSIERQK